MSTGVFSLMCPTCGADLHPGDEGVETCAGCGTDYVERFGYLFRCRVIATESATLAPGGSETSPN
jgi:hypothetical protein